jgi:lipoyl(octanoyl) transferase
MARVLRTYRLGRVEYGDGLALMRLAGDAVRAGTPAATDFLFLLEHPPVLTLGRSAGREHIVAAPAWLEKQGFEIHETDRGGDVTYHGPGQIVGYPVLDLNGRKDVRRYVGALDEAMIRTCADFGVEAGRHPEHRGCWVGRKKIGAIGVHLSRWITSHGFAFNVRTDLAHFQVIVPCGIADPRLGVTSLEAELSARGCATPEQAEIENRLAAHLAGILELARTDAGPDLRTISVVPVRADGRVLLLRRSPERGGFWQQVTGRIEPGESPEQAARRELREETGADLPVLLAVVCSFRDRPLARQLVAFGEVGLAGEIRPAPRGQERLKEAAKLGFTRAIVPRANAPKKGRVGELEVVGVERLAEALEACR